MFNETSVGSGEVAPTILLIDDEDDFRKGLAQQLKVRNFHILDTNNGEDAIKIVRHDNPQVVILDQKMPGMDGIQTLKEIKKVRPETQVIMHTGHGCTESARITGKHDVFRYIEKPCAIEELILSIHQALDERSYALARHEIPDVKGRSIRQWLVGAHNARPGIISLGAVLFLLMALMPTPDSLEKLLSTPKHNQVGESMAGYSDYSKMNNSQTISDFYAAKAKLVTTAKSENGQCVKAPPKIPIDAQQVAFRAKVMVGILIMAALFWATGAVPIGITALLVGVLMIFFNVFNPGDVAKAYAKDSVVFIFSVLALAAAISKTGLDRRIGILLLGTSTNLVKFGLIFAPLLSITASFLSEHALVAFIAPILMMVYLGAIRSAGLQKDKTLVVMLMLTFCGNVGGPGSPAAGGGGCAHFADHLVGHLFLQVWHGRPGAACAGCAEHSGHPALEGH